MVKRGRTPAMMRMMFSHHFTSEKARLSAAEVPVRASTCLKLKHHGLARRSQPIHVRSIRGGIYIIV